MNYLSVNQHRVCTHLTEYMQHHEVLFIQEVFRTCKY